eukprot:TRINITY_DN74637_c0_g1_i1.p1 TRINITY_DN74637_c0_g1~~TRINITY_DN74637_c0_g1_i1.p1  ORF type:complete len:760 (-),score=128.85 TRINITY_DN74637_c0_g1_i1:58-2337(-)
MLQHAPTSTRPNADAKVPLVRKDTYCGCSFRCCGTVESADEYDADQTQTEGGFHVDAAIAAINGNSEVSTADTVEMVEAEIAEIELVRRDVSKLTGRSKSFIEQVAAVVLGEQDQANQDGKTTTKQADSSLPDESTKPAEPEEDRPLKEVGASNSLLVASRIRAGLRTFKQKVAEHKAISPLEQERGVYIERAYDFYDPVTRTCKQMKVKDDVIHRRAQDDKEVAVEGDEDTQSECTESEASASSTGSRAKRRSRSGSIDSNLSSNNDEPLALAKRTIKRRATPSNMEFVTRWGVLVGKLLYKRVLNFRDVTNSALGKRRVDMASRTGAVLSHIKSRAMLVSEQVMAMAKTVANESQDVFDNEWGSQGYLAELFSTEYLDTLILLTKGARKCMATQPMLTRCEPPCKVFGDTHGQLRDLLLLLHAFGMPMADDKESPCFIFNGDFVDRGEHSLEVVGSLFALKLACPEKVFLLRGNHEDRQMNQLYGFEDECHHRLGKKFGGKLFEMVQAAFEQMPLANIIGQRIMVVHGGIGRGKWTLQDVQSVRRPLDANELSKPESQWIYDILWSDPIEDSLSNSVFGVHESPRGKLASQFAWDVSKTFCARNGISLIIRSHQSKEDSLGFEVMHENLVMRVFSARDYEGHGNDGAVLHITYMEKSATSCHREGIMSVRPQVLRSTTKYKKEIQEKTMREKKSRMSERISAVDRRGGEEKGARRSSQITGRAGAPAGKAAAGGSAASPKRKSQITGRPAVRPDAAR